MCVVRGNVRHRFVCVFVRLLIYSFVLPHRAPRTHCASPLGETLAKNSTGPSRALGPQMGPAAPAPHQQSFSVRLSLTGQASPRGGLIGKPHGAGRPHGRLAGAPGWRTSSATGARCTSDARCPPVCPPRGLGVGASLVTAPSDGGPVRADWPTRAARTGPVGAGRRSSPMMAGHTGQPVRP